MKLKKSLVPFSLVFGALFFFTAQAAPKQAIDSNSLRISSIIALEYNGTPLPSEDAACLKEYQRYMGRVYAIDSSTPLTAPTLTLCSTDGCGTLENISLRDTYLFWEPHYQGTNRVFYSEKMGTNHQKLGLFFNYNNHQCVATAGELP